MKRLSLLAAMALVTGCSILGYRDVNDLKAEAKDHLVKEVDRDPVLVYRDVSRALSGCTKDAVAGPYRRVISSLDRQTDGGVVSLTHDGRFIAHYEISKTADNKALVSGWWLVGSRMCAPVL
ncbi:MAG: hypothetical protein J7605_27535 [Variovorax sp.]|nr:hypothetical protein [Variovorax sp.]